jgi:hypothetical protein
MFSNKYSIFQDCPTQCSMTRLLRDNLLKDIHSHMYPIHRVLHINKTKNRKSACNKQNSAWQVKSSEYISSARALLEKLLPFGVDWLGDNSPFLKLIIFPLGRPDSYIIRKWNHTSSLTWETMNIQWNSYHGNALNLNFSCLWIKLKPFVIIDSKV